MWVKFTLTAGLPVLKNKTIFFQELIMYPC